MIKEPQPITIKVVRPNIAKWYQERGYQGVKTGDIITIEAKDISLNSHRKIFYVCDYCGEEYERVPYSAYRCRQTGLDACINCSRKKAEATTLAKYGVKNAMQVDEFLQKQRESCKNNENFQKKTNSSASCFEKGIPVSKAQKNLADCLSGFELNYQFEKYYLDLCNGKIAIEYDGSGHDLIVRTGKMSSEDFEKKEEVRKESVENNFRLLQIRDLKDRFRKKENINKYLDVINSFINGNEKFLFLEIS